MALHAFRVALRRLRSTLQMYRPVLGRDMVPRKLQRRLKRLARATGAARDAEIGLLWLRRNRAFAGDTERAACNCLVAAWKADRDASYKDVRKRLEKKFDKLDTGLRRAVADWSGAAAPMLAPTIGQLMAERIAAVSAELQQITSVADVDAIHAARIEAKRLRYLLEPVLPELTDGAALLKSLKRFQDQFGELCDRQMLSEQLITAARRDGAHQSAAKLQSILGYDAGTETADVRAAAGLIELGRRLRAEREQRFAEIAPRYLGENAHAFLAPYRSAAQRLIGGPSSEESRGR